MEIDSESFTGRVLAVLSRRSPGFRPSPDHSVTPTPSEPHSETGEPTSHAHNSHQN